jgi:flagellar basal-body rod modification protein FlgD
MSVASVTGTVDTTGKTTGTTGATTQLLNMDAFMNLLVTQLKYQDPLDPMKTNEFMNQLAALTSVERLQNINDSLTGLQTTMQTGNMVDMIGKKIQVDGNTLSRGDQFTVTPLKDYDRVVFTIKNINDGSTETVTRYKGDSLTYTNEGTNTLQVAAVAYNNGNAVGSTAAAYRTVTGVKSGASSVSLVTGNGEEYPASSIKEIKN